MDKDEKIIQIFWIKDANNMALTNKGKVFELRPIFKKCEEPDGVVSFSNEFELIPIELLA